MISVWEEEQQSFLSLEAASEKSDSILLPLFSYVLSAPGCTKKQERQHFMVGVCQNWVFDINKSLPQELGFHNKNVAARNFS